MKKSYDRKFGGQKFKLFYIHDNKTPCKDVAKRVRLHGRKARVIHMKGGAMAEWGVYRGPKRKKQKNNPRKKWRGRKPNAGMRRGPNS